MALVRYLDDSLPPRPDKIFREAEAGRGHLYLPEIALAEFAYLSLKGKLRDSDPELSVREVVHNLRASPAFTISGLSPDAWDVFIGLPIREMHDRLIAADAIARRIPLISSDPAFAGVRGLRVVW